MVTSYDCTTYLVKLQTITYTVYSLNPLRFPNLRTKSKQLLPIPRFEILLSLILDKDSTPYTFAKLSKSANYKKWSRQMPFAFQEAELWEYITGNRKKPRELTAKKNDDEDRLEKMEERNLDRLEFDKKE